MFLLSFALGPNGDEVEQTKQDNEEADLEQFATRRLGSLGLRMGIGNKHGYLLLWI